MPETKTRTERESSLEQTPERETSRFPERQEQEGESSGEEEASGEERAPELEEVREYIEERKEEDETEVETQAPARKQSGGRGEYAWLEDIPIQERVEKAYEIVLQKQKRMVEAVDAFLALQDYDNLDAFEATLRERYEELAQAGLVSSVRGEQ